MYSSGGIDLKKPAIKAADAHFIDRPNFSARSRTVLWVTMIPRYASMSSTIRKLSGNRKRSHTASAITEAESDGGDKARSFAFTRRLGTLFRS